MLVSLLFTLHPVTGVLGEQQLAKYHQKERSMQGPGGLLARMAAGARGHSSSSSSSKASSYKNCWTMQIQTVCRPGVLAELAAGKAAAAAGVAGLAGNRSTVYPAAAADDNAAAVAHSEAAAAAASVGADEGEADQLQQQLCHSRSSSSSSFNQAAAAAAESQKAQQQPCEALRTEVADTNAESTMPINRDQIATEQYTWQISAVSDVSPPGLSTVAAAGTTAGSSSSASGQPVWITAAVAVCIKQGSRNGKVVPAGGEHEHPAGTVMR